MSTPTPKPRVAVVGGGISGLLAALQMAEAGYAVDIFEASDRRLGGKIETARLGDIPISTGAEFIDSDSKMVELAKALNVPLLECADQKALMVHLTDHSVMSEDDFLTAYRPMSKLVERDKKEIEEHPDGALARKIDQMTVPAYLESLNREARSKSSLVTKVLAFLRLKKDPNAVDQKVIDTVAGIYGSEAGRDPAHISARQFVAEAKADQSMETGSLLAADCAYRVDGGTERILDALKERLAAHGAQFHVGAKATAVHKQGDQIGVAFENQPNAPQMFDKVVFATPMGALAHIKGLTELGLPNDARQTLQNGQYTHTSKMFVRLKPGAAKKLRNDCFMSAEGFQAWQQCPDVMVFLIGGEKVNSRKGEALAKHMMETFAKANGVKVNDIFDTSQVVLRGPDTKHPCYASPAPGQVGKLHALSASFDAMAQNGVGVVGTFIPGRSGNPGSVGFMESGVDSTERITALMTGGKAQALTRDKTTQRQANHMHQHATPALPHAHAHTHSHAHNHPHKNPAQKNNSWQH